MQAIDITPAKYRVLEVFDTFPHPWNPTIREIAAILKRSPATIHEHIRFLCINGYLNNSMFGSRQYSLANKTRQLINSYVNETDTESCHWNKK